MHGRSPLLRLQSDERLVALMRRGNHAAFEHLVGRYQSRLLAFCRHMLVSVEDAEDVLQDVFAAAFNAILADDRPINVRPWLYRIARNRCLNHLRKASAIGVDSMDVHLSDHGETTADQVHRREDFRLLVDDIRDLPETQRTALLLREMEALSYEQIAEAMETTIPGVKSLLVRARVSLAEAAEARQLTCAEVRLELGEVAEGLRRRTTPPVRRHLRSCERCSTFRGQLKETNRALAALLPVGPVVVLRKLLLTHLSHGAGAGAGSHATAAGGTAAAAGSTAAAGGAAAGGSTAAAGGTAAAAAGGTAAAAGGTAGGTAAAAAGGTAAAAGGTAAAAGGTAAAAGGTAAAAGGTAAAAGGTAAAAGGTAAAGGSAVVAAGGSAAAAASTLAAGSTATSLVSAGVGAVATKAAAGLAAAAIVTAGAVEVDQTGHHKSLQGSPLGATVVPANPAQAKPTGREAHRLALKSQAHKRAAQRAAKTTTTATTPTTTSTTTPPLVPSTPGRTETTTISTTLPSSGAATSSPASGAEVITTPTMTSTTPVLTPTTGSCTVASAPAPGSSPGAGATATPSPTGTSGATTAPAPTTTTTTTDPTTPAPAPAPPPTPPTCSATGPGVAPGAPASSTAG
jgi:RNA polymerase sigma factor (sigma-70 family)